MSRTPQRGDFVEVVSGRHQGATGTIAWTTKPKKGRPAPVGITVGKREEITVMASEIRAAEPPPKRTRAARAKKVKRQEPVDRSQRTPPTYDTSYPTPIPRAEKPAGWSGTQVGPAGPVPPPDCFDPATVERLSLLRRFGRTEDGRLYVSAHLLSLEELDGVLDTLDDVEVGVHFMRLGAFPGLGAWLRWPRLAKLRHVSFEHAQLSTKRLGWLLGSGALASVRTLGLGGTGLTAPGLRLLKQSEVMADLVALEIGVNADFGRVSHDGGSLKALLAPTKACPVGDSLIGLEHLGLTSWTFDDTAVGVLRESFVARGLKSLDLGGVRTRVGAALAAIGANGGRLERLRLADTDTADLRDAPAEPLPIRHLRALRIPIADLARTWFWSGLTSLDLDVGKGTTAWVLPHGLRELRIEQNPYYPMSKAALDALAGVAERLERLEISATFEDGAFDAAWPAVLRDAVRPAG